MAVADPLLLKPSDLQVDADPGPDELDALLDQVGEPPEVVISGREVAEHLLEESIWDQVKHPRWPKGTHDATGKNIGGEFMRAGQTFMLDGHRWEITHVAGGRVIAIEASGAVGKAETRVFTPSMATFAGVKHPTIKGAKYADPWVLASGKGKFQTHNSPVMDSEVHPESHDASIKLPATSSLSPEEWQQFGLPDQLLYVELMDRYGAWNEGSQQLLGSPKHLTPKMSKAVQKSKQEFGDSDAASVLSQAFGSQKGPGDTGHDLDLTVIFNEMYSSGPAALAAAWTRYEHARELEQELNGVLAWDLYNRVRGPDISLRHKDNHDSSWWSDIVEGKTPLMSGPSSTWTSQNVWHEPHTLAYVSPIRNIALAEDLGKPFSWGNPEHEVATANRMRLRPTNSTYWMSHQLKENASNPVWKWLTGFMAKHPAAGNVIRGLVGHLSGKAPLPLPPPDADLSITKQPGGGVQTYAIPPDEFMAQVEKAMKKNAGTFVDGSGQHVPEGGAYLPIKSLNLTPGDIITTKDPQTRYLVIADSGQPTGMAYLALGGVGGDYEAKKFTFSSWDVSRRKVNQHFDIPVEHKPGVKPPDHVPGEWQFTKAKLPVSKLDVGDKVRVGGDDWTITHKSVSLVTLASLTAPGKEATVNAGWPTFKLEKIKQIDPAPGVKGVLSDKWVVTLVKDLGDDRWQVSKPDGSVAVAALKDLDAFRTPVPEKAAKGDTFMLNGVRMTVSSTLKNGTVRAKSSEKGAHVQAFPPGDPALGSLFRPSDYALGAKAKVGGLKPGQLVSGSQVRVRPYVVLGTTGNQSWLLNWDTGEQVHVGKNKSFAVLVSAAEVAAEVPEVPLPVPAAAGEKAIGSQIHGEDLKPGDLFSDGPGGESVWKVLAVNLGLPGGKIKIVKVKPSLGKEMLSGANAPGLKWYYQGNQPVEPGGWIDLAAKTKASDLGLQPGDQFVGAASGDVYEVLPGGKAKDLTAGGGLTTNLNKFTSKYKKAATPGEWVNLPVNKGVAFLGLTTGDHFLGWSTGKDYVMVAPGQAQVVATGEVKPSKGLKAKAYKLAAHAPAGEAVDAGSLPDAVQDGEFQPFKSGYGPGGKYKYEPLLKFTEGAVVLDKAGKPWVVKQAGSQPILSDGHALFKADGAVKAKAVEFAAKPVPFVDHTPPVDGLEKALADGMTVNAGSQTMADLGLQPGDQYVLAGQPWTVTASHSGLYVTSTNASHGSMVQHGAGDVPSAFKKVANPDAAPSPAGQDYGFADFKAYKSHYGPSGKYKYEPLSTFKAGDLVLDKSGKVWSVKVAGAEPILSDGFALFKAEGGWKAKKATDAPASKVAAFVDHAPEVGGDVSTSVQMKPSEVAVGMTFTVASAGDLASWWAWPGPYTVKHSPEVGGGIIFADASGKEHYIAPGSLVDDATLVAVPLPKPPHLKPEVVPGSKGLNQGDPVQVQDLQVGDTATWAEDGTSVKWTVVEKQPDGSANVKTQEKGGPGWLTPGTKTIYFWAGPSGQTPDAAPLKPLFEPQAGTVAANTLPTHAVAEWKGDLIYKNPLGKWFLLGSDGPLSIKTAKVKPVTVNPPDISDMIATTEVPLNDLPVGGVFASGTGAKFVVLGHGADGTHSLRLDTSQVYFTPIDASAQVVKYVAPEAGPLDPAELQQQQQQQQPAGLKFKKGDPVTPSLLQVGDTATYAEDGSSKKWKVVEKLNSGGTLASSEASGGSAVGFAPNETMYFWSGPSGSEDEGAEPGTFATVPVGGFFQAHGGVWQKKGADTMELFHKSGSQQIADAGEVLPASPADEVTALEMMKVQDMPPGTTYMVSGTATKGTVIKKLADLPGGKMKLLMVKSNGKSGTPDGESWEASQSGNANVVLRGPGLEPTPEPVPGGMAKVADLNVGDKFDGPASSPLTWWAAHPGPYEVVSKDHGSVKLGTSTETLSASLNSSVGQTLVQVKAAGAEPIPETDLDGFVELPATPIKNLNLKPGDQVKDSLGDIDTVTAVDGDNVSITWPTSTGAVAKVTTQSLLITHVKKKPAKAKKAKHSVTDLPPEGVDEPPSKPPAPEATAIKQFGGPFKLGESAGGTTGAVWATDPNGKKYILKAYGGNEDRVATEALANAIYQRLGVPTPAGGVAVMPGGKLAFVAPKATAASPDTGEWSEHMKAQMAKDFVADALVGNYDHIGLERDNVLWGPGDKPIRVDQGGTFMFRAQGKPKAFNPVPDEMWSMLGPHGQALANGLNEYLPEQELRDQALSVSGMLTDSDVDALVDAAPFASSLMRETIRKSLKARLDWLTGYGTGMHETPPEVAKVLAEPSAPSEPAQEMPIKPYTSAYQSGGKGVYDKLADLGVGTTFRDKAGKLYSIVGQVTEYGSHFGTTPPDTPPGSAVVAALLYPPTHVTVPHTFVHPKTGKRVPTRVKVVQ